MDFVKMEGLGNDFVIVEGPAAISPAEVQRGATAASVWAPTVSCLATPLAGQKVAMEYWNADGGKAEMCGNGLRCIAKLALQRGWVEDGPMEIETAVGPLGAEVLDDGEFAR